MGCVCSCFGFENSEDNQEDRSIRSPSAFISYFLNEVRTRFYRLILSFYWPVCFIRKKGNWKLIVIYFSLLKYVFY